MGDIIKKSLLVLIMSLVFVGCSDDGGLPSRDLAGSSEVGALSYSPSVLNFGSVALNSSSILKTVKFTNSGSEVLDVEISQLVGFTTSPTEFTLQKGSSRTVSVTMGTSFLADFNSSPQILNINGRENLNSNGELIFVGSVTGGTNSLVNGLCDSVNELTCVDGIFVDLVNEVSTFKWMCRGINQGSDMTCSSECPLGSKIDGNNQCVEFVCDSSIDPSEHFVTDQDKVLTYYNIYLGRIPDPNGAEYWTGDRVSFLNALFDSKNKELIDRTYSTLPIYRSNPASVAYATQYVEQIYSNFWFSTPGGEGLNYWVNDLLNNQNAYTPAKKLITAIFNGYLGTSCEDGGLTYEERKVVTARQLTQINAHELSRYFVSKSIKSSVYTPGNTSHAIAIINLTMAWYQDIVSNTSKELSTVQTSTEMKARAADVLDRAKTTVDNWCSINCD